METMLAHVALDQIQVSDTNKMFRDAEDLEQQALQELTDSVREKGVIQPVLLRPSPNKAGAMYQLVCGERRFRACLAVRVAFKDRKTIPAYIRELSDEEALDLQITENLQRENVNPVKEAFAFEWMVKNKKLTTRMIAERIGKSQDYVQERLRLCTLQDKVRELVRSGVIPLKAALKIASVPAQLQQEAIEECTDTIEGTQGKQIVFTGMSDLQGWLNWNVFNDLAIADFDTADPELVPAAGSCAGCTKRTRNAGGLFDDVSKKDQCFDGGCFRAKQLATYKLAAQQVKVNFVGAPSVFLQRGWSIDDTLKREISKLGKLIPSANFKEITKAELSKKLEDYDKGKDPKVMVAILVGSSSHDAKLNKEKFKFYFTGSEPDRSRAPQKTLKQKEKEVADIHIQKRQSFLEKKFEAEVILKKFEVSALPDFVLRALVFSFANDIDAQDLLHAFDHLKISCNLDTHTDKKVKVFNPGYDFSNWGGWINDTSLTKVLSSLKTKQLNALLVYVALQSYQSIDLSAKDFKVDNTALARKAKEQAALWWKDQQKEKPKSEKSKPQAGLKKLLKKK